MKETSFSVFKAKEIYTSFQDSKLCLRQDGVIHNPLGTQLLLDLTKQ